MTSAYINEKINQIKNLLQEGDIKQALDILCDFASEFSLEDREREAIALSARHSQNESEAIKGTKTKEDSVLERNRVVDFAQGLLYSIQQEAQIKIKEVEASAKIQAQKEIDRVLSSARILDDYHLADIIKRADEYKLEELDLSNKAIEFLPREISHLHELKKLNLSHNLLKELPPYISKLTALVELDLSHNQLTELPCELSELLSLQDLKIDQNPLEYPAQSIINKGLDSILVELARKFRTKKNDLDVIFEELKIGQAVSAVIVDKPEFGLFLSYKGLEGLLHKNNISKNKLAELEDMFIGDQVEVLVFYKTEIDGKRRLSFAMPGNDEDVNMRTTAKNLADNMINQAIKNNSHILDLSKIGLESLSRLIGKCTNLEVLYLNNNKLTSLPGEICRLPKLKRLYLQNNHLSKLPEEMGMLEQLVTLHLANNKLGKLPASLVNLDLLSDIIISGNPCSINMPVNDAEKIKIAIKDSILNSGKNEIEYSNFKPGEVLLGQIKLIYNYGVFVRIVKDGDYKEGLLHKSAVLINGRDYWKTLHKFFEIGDKLEVRILDLQPDQDRVTFALHDSFPSFITNKVFNIINSAKNNRYTRLDLSNAELTALPKEIGELDALVELDLSNNPIRSLPSEMNKLKRLKKLYIDNIPPEIASKDAIDIVNYFLKNQDRPQVKKNLKEAKMLIVGQGGVGKTSLVKRLVYNNYDDNELKTEGIDIRKWEIMVNKEPIYLNIWDFGGQEILHSTHQFFLTQRSIYLLVWDARQEDEHGRIDYWLKLIQSFGGDSPIIVVMNKIDTGYREINRRGLTEKYKNIIAFVDVSCKTGEGLVKLNELIQKEVSQLEHLKIDWYQSWFNIKTRLEELNRDYCEYGEYEKMCEQEQLDKENQKLLIRFLHDLGIVLNFQDDPRLKYTNILSPQWVTNAVYKIINHPELRENKGILSLEEISSILDRVKYPVEKHALIVDLMHKFELAYYLDEAHNRFLIPELLPVEQPAFIFNFEKCLSFRYHYNFLPDSIMSRFIVRMHQYVYREKNKYGQILWRSGVILKEKENKALIISDKIDKRVFIFIEGQKNTRREFLSKIRGHFDHIHSTISRIEAREIIPLYPDKDIYVDYNYLLALENKGVETYIAQDTYEEFNIKDLLEGYA